MITSFDDAFAALIQNEGKLSMDKNDPGNWSSGKVGIGTLDGTMYGISAPVARRHGYLGEMKDLPLDLAKSIAKAEYWSPYLCDQMPPLVAFQVLDAAYNGGKPARWLQQSVGVSVDGSIGAKTIAAVRMMDAGTIIRRFDGYRLRYVASLEIFDEDGRGLCMRIANNLLRE